MYNFKLQIYCRYYLAISTTYNFEKEEYVEDIERGLYILEEILEKYIDSHHKLAFLYNDLYQEIFGEEFQENKKNLHDLKSGGQQRIKELKQLAKTLSEQKEEASKRKFDEKVTVSKHIFQEIESRSF